MSNENKYEIRVMTIDDYDEVYSLWQTIHGFGIRSIDDSREGVLRFLKRNPTTSVVAVEDGKIVGRRSAGWKRSGHQPPERKRKSSDGRRRHQRCITTPPVRTLSRAFAKK